MRILHFQSNGVGSVLSREMNRRGIHSRVMSTGRHPFGFHSDYTLPSRLPIIGPQGLAWWLLKRMSRFYDVLHSHDGVPLPASVLKAWEGRFVQHYHNPLAQDFYPGRTIPAFVATPAMKIPNSEWLPLPVDTKLFYPKPRYKYLTIGYSYNKDADPNKLKYIPHKEISEFASKHHFVNIFHLTKTIPHSLMPQFYQSLDIYVDRIGLDSYGWQACEAAACGAVVVGQHKGVPSDCPFIYTGREALQYTLKLLLNANLDGVRQACVDYAVRYHSVRKVVERCLAKYREIL